MCCGGGGMRLRVLTCLRVVDGMERWAGLCVGCGGGTCAWVGELGFG